MSETSSNHRFQAIRRRSRLVASFPWLSRLGEFSQLFRAAARWRKEGWFVPVPHFVRRAGLLTQARSINAEIFVETGTYKGGTTWCLLKEFRRIDTMEVVPELAALARERFTNCPKVTVIEGDSANLLPEVCKSLDAPTLFYLDGHYSGGVTGKGTEECPVINELQAIFTNIRVPFAIVIDDAREFGTDPAYPTIDTVAEYVRQHRPSLRTRVENDAIVIHA